MEKPNRPVNASWFGLKDGESDIIDAELLVDLLETYRFGKDNVPAGEFRFKAVAPALAPVNITTEIEVEVQEEDDGSQGTNSVHESTSSVFSSSDPMIHESAVSETGSNNETNSTKESGSNEENGIDSLESSSMNLANVENEMQQNRENGETEGQEEEEEQKSEKSLSDSEENSNLDKLLATQDNYELYCPCCSSCITRKVILKKRKRGKHVDLSTDLKLNVTVDETNEPSDIEETELPVKVHVLPETRIEEDVQEAKEEGIIFTCLACLKYFIRLAEVNLEVMSSVNTTQSLPRTQPDGERFVIELLKSTVYGGLTETITSLGVVSSASASGSSIVNILALAIANLAGGLIVLAQNLQDLRNSSDQEKDRYKELLGRRDNIRIHILVAVMSYIFFGLIPPLVYAFSFYETGIKTYKLLSAFSVSLVCVILLGLIKVYVSKPPNSCESRKAYLKSAAHYTSIVVASSGISYFVGDIMGEYIGKLSWISLDQVNITSPFDGIKPEEYRFTSF